MKVLITGVSGRVGANLGLQMKQKGYQVHGLIMPNDPKYEKVRELGIEIFDGDIVDSESVYNAVEGMDIIVHLAAQMKQGLSTAQQMFEINALGSLNVLEGALRSSCKPKSFV